VFGRVGILVEQCFGGDQKAGRADSALQSGSFEEALLKGVQMTMHGHSFNRLQRCPFGFHREHDATIHGHAIHDYGAGAAVAIIATFLRSGQPQLVAENLQETLPRFAEEFAFLPVNRRGDVMLFSSHTGARRGSRTGMRRRCGRVSWHNLVVFTGVPAPWRWRACVE